MLQTIIGKIPYLKAISPKLYSSVALTFILRAIQMLLSLVTIYFLARALSKESFGEYNFILAVAGTLSLFSLKGLNESVTQAVARGLPGTYRAALKPALLGSLIGSALLAAGGAWYMLEGNHQLSLGFFITAALFPLVHGLTLWKSVIAGVEDFAALLRREGLNALIMCVLTVAGVLLFPDNLLVPVISVMLVPGLQNLSQTIRSYKSIGPSAAVEAGNVPYGIKTSFYTALTIIATHLDKFLLFLFLSPQSLAVFAVADKIAEMVRGVTQDVAAVLAPRLARHKNYTETLDRAFLFFSFVMGTAIIAFAFTLLPWVLILIFGDAYADAVPYAQGLMCSVAIGNIAVLRARFIRSKLDEESYRNITVQMSVVRILSSIVFVPWLGIAGAVISAIVYRFAMSVIVHIALRRRYPAVSRQ